MKGWYAAEEDSGVLQTNVKRRQPLLVRDEQITMISNIALKPEPLRMRLYSQNSKKPVKYTQWMYSPGWSDREFKVVFWRRAAPRSACYWASAAQTASAAAWWRRRLGSSGLSWSRSSGLWSESPAGPPRCLRPRWPIGLRKHATFHKFHQRSNCRR